MRYQNIRIKDNTYQRLQKVDSKTVDLKIQTLLDSFFGEQIFIDDREVMEIWVEVDGSNMSLLTDGLIITGDFKSATIHFYLDNNIRDENGNIIEERDPYLDHDYDETYESSTELKERLNELPKDVEITFT